MFIKRCQWQLSGEEEGPALCVCWSREASVHGRSSAGVGDAGSRGCHGRSHRTTRGPGCSLPRPPGNALSEVGPVPGSLSPRHTPGCGSFAGAHVSRSSWAKRTAPPASDRHRALLSSRARVAFMPQRAGQVSMGTKRTLERRREHVRLGPSPGSPRRGARTDFPRKGEMAPRTPARK